jgi:hypothetical protein
MKPRKGDASWEEVMGGADGWALNPTTAHARARQNERHLPPEALVPRQGGAAVTVGQRVVTVLPTVRKPNSLPGSFAINATLYGPRSAPSSLFKDAVVFRAAGAEGGGGGGGGGGGDAAVRVDIAGCEGQVIGKGAAKIKALVEAHKVDVAIDGGAAVITPTRLAGCSGAGARAAIEDICRRARTPPAEPVVVPIGDGAGRVIGRGGCVIKALQERHRVSIERVGDAMHIRPLQDDSDVQGACREVAEIAAGRSGGGGGPVEGLPAPAVVDVAGAAGAVIGEAGRVIKGLKVKYRVQMMVENNSVARISALVAQSDVEGARQEVAALVAAARAKAGTKM